MSHFDFLIDADNGKPNPNMEYVYCLDIIWRPDRLGHSTIKKGSIMVDVIQLDNKSYEFTSKENGERFRTNYAWALVENTPENIKLYNEYEIENMNLKIFQEKVKSLRAKVKTLE